MTLEHSEAQGVAVSPWRAVAFGEGWQSAGGRSGDRSSLERRAAMFAY
jgi:hypothetical protein